MSSMIDNSKIVATNEFNDVSKSPLSVLNYVERTQKNIILENASHSKVFAFDPTSYQDGWITISIGDNGLGMTEAVRQKLFNAFFTTKPKGKGTVCNG